VTNVMLNSSLDVFLTEQAQRTNAHLSAIADGLPGHGVGKAMRYALAGGGKRLRPALCVATWRAIKGEENDAVQKLAAAIEIIHTYSLVHDDLPCMDDDSFRRGRETTHRVFGEAVAMLAGAALIPLAFRVIAEAADTLGLDAAQQVRIHQTVARAAGAGGMVGGQVLDLEGTAAVTTTSQLEKIHAAKTGALIVASCLVGALAADAPAAQLDGVAEYGRHLGLAFQITDDVLDETASSADLGKTAGKDRDGAKATYPALLGLERARVRAAGEALEAVAALAKAGLQDPLLKELATFAIERKR
jgi:geranylgeranyl pyrophosphate synthase